jgi:hypothetical protein
MTATIVNGQAVIADEPTASPIKDKAGNYVLWQKVRTLLLEDGDTVYGCLLCDYTSPNSLSIRPHLNAHSTKQRSPRGTKTTAKLADELSLADLLGKVGELEKVTTERNEWKARAQKAEKKLQLLRETFGGKL